MLTFFRKIRRSFVGGNTTSRYVLYAVGEIALVVIGILIALQINNWNEYRKDRNMEQKILSEIAITIEEDIAQLESAVERMEESQVSSDLILAVWLNKSSYSDTLGYHFWRATWPSIHSITSLSTAGYEGLKNAGFDIIADDSLRKEVILLFEQTIPRLIATFTVNEKYQPIYHEHYKKNFFSVTEDGRWPTYVPFNYDKLLHDTYYYSIIQGVRSTRGLYINVTNSALLEMKRVLQLIRAEVEI